MRTPRCLLRESSSVPGANALCPVESVTPANLNSEWHTLGSTLFYIRRFGPLIT